MSLRWTEEELEEYQRRLGYPKPYQMGKVARAKRGTDEVLKVNPTEDEEQISLFDWARVNEGNFPELCRLFHVPNGGSRGPAEAGRFKAMGVKKGVPDVFLDVPRGGFHGLRIEMKRRHGGKVSEDQTDWIDYYNQTGFRAVICYGWDEAREEIENYLHGGDGE